MSAPFITDEQARGMAERMRQRAAEDPLFAEDIASITESMPYVIRHDGSKRPIVCECCGTYVFDPLEAHSAEPRTWTRAIWEAETGRKHTPRRCNWKRERDASAAPPAPLS